MCASDERHDKKHPRAHDVGVQAAGVLAKLERAWKAVSAGGVEKIDDVVLAGAAHEGGEGGDGLGGSKDKGAGEGVGSVDVVVFGPGFVVVEKGKRRSVPGEFFVRAGVGGGRSERAGAVGGGEVGFGGVFEVEGLLLDVLQVGDDVLVGGRAALAAAGLVDCADGTLVHEQHVCQMLQGGEVEGRVSSAGILIGRGCQANVHVQTAVGGGECAVERGPVAFEEGEVGGDFGEGGGREGQHARDELDAMRVPFSDINHAGAQLRGQRGSVDAHDAGIFAEMPAPEVGALA